LQKKSLNEIQTVTGLSHPTIITAYKNFLSGGWKALEPQLRGRPIGSKRLTEDLLTSLMHDLLASPYTELWPTPTPWDIEAVSEWLKKRLVLASEKTISRYLKTLDWLPCNESVSFSRKLLQQQFTQKNQSNTQVQALNLTSERLKNLPIFIIGSRKIDTTRSSLTAYQLYARDTKNKVTWAHQSTPFNESDIVDFLGTLHTEHTDGFIAIFNSSIH
jgi:sulfate adenylyltransferase subunit 2